MTPVSSKNRGPTNLRYWNWTYPELAVISYLLFHAANSAGEIARWISQETQSTFRENKAYEVVDRLTTQGLAQKTATGISLTEAGKNEVLSRNMFGARQALRDKTDVAKQAETQEEKNLRIILEKGAMEIGRLQEAKKLEKRVNELLDAIPTSS